MNEYDVAMMACAVVCVVMTAWTLNRFSRVNYRISRLMVKTNDVRARLDLLEELVDKLVLGPEDEDEGEDDK